MERFYPGQPIRRALSADNLNIIRESTDYTGAHHALGGISRISGRKYGYEVIEAYNDCGRTVYPGEVVSIDTLAAAPSDADDLLGLPVRLPVKEAVTGAPLAVVAEEAEDQMCFHAVVSGAVFIQMTILDVNHKSARAVTGSTIAESCDDGPMQILWQGGGYAAVLLNAGGSHAAQAERYGMFDVRLASESSGETVSWKVTCTNTAATSTQSAGVCNVNNHSFNVAPLEAEAKDGTVVLKFQAPSTTQLPSQGQTQAVSDYGTCTLEYLDGHDIPAATEFVIYYVIAEIRSVNGAWQVSQAHQPLGQIRLTWQGPAFDLLRDHLQAGYQAS